MKKNYFLILFLLITLIAAFLRLYKLDNRPAHFDEGGGHAIGVRELLKSGVYVYNPDFHGPFLYHITALVFYLFGMSDITLRITQAIFGIGTVAILLLLKNYVKKETILALAILLAFSPSLVYYSRFAVHDSYFVFFTLSTIIFLFLYDKTRENKYLYLFFASLAFLFTVKENAYIFLGSILFYFFLEFLMELFSKKGSLKNRLKKNSYFVWLKNNKEGILFGILIFFVIFSTLYTSFFRYNKNLITAILDPFRHWLHKTTTQTGFFQPPSFYLRILEEYDTAIFVLGVIGIFTPLFFNNKYTRFAAIFAAINLISYLLMPYKEPNNVVHIVLPLAISAGVLIEYVNDEWRKNILLFILAISIYSLFITWQTSFVKYADEKNYLVYVQSV
ncbi:MAG: TIGR03663 family protein, partial [Candidatus Micrarchaeia archaeon]